MSKSTVSQIETILRSAGETFYGSENQLNELARDWDACFTVAGVDRWVSAGCWDVDTAAELAEAGFRPGVDELSYTPGNERDNMDPMYALCNGDTSIEKLTW